MSHSAVRKKPSIRRPALMLFESAADAVECAQELLNKFAPYHLKYLSAARIHEINHLMREEHPALGHEKEMAEKDTLLMCFEEGAGKVTSPNFERGLSLRP